jgi:hypothetical protein
LFSMRRFAAAGALILVAGCGPGPPISDRTDGYYRGFLRSGGKFGISMDMPIERARAILNERGISYVGDAPCNSRMQKIAACGPKEIAEVYALDETFRRGKIFVFKSQGKVAGIVWVSRLFPPLHF